MVRGNPTEVFLVFLKLGLTSFGGPVAHLGYFRSEFVERRKWLSESSYADLVALCRVLRRAKSGSPSVCLAVAILVPSLHGRRSRCRLPLRSSSSLTVSLRSEAAPVAVGFTG